MKKGLWGLWLFLAVILIGTALALGPVIAQGVGQAVSIMVGGNYVSSTNPLPVTGGGGAGPTPIPWSTASPEPVSCVVVAAVGICPTPIPFPASFPAPQPSPLYTTPVQGLMANCNSSFINCVAPTASPNGAAALNLLPMGVCANNAGTLACAAVNAFQQMAVVAPAPSATQPVSCQAAANCPVNASQVTSPWVVTTINPALPAPQVTWPVSSPVPYATAGNGAVGGTLPNAQTGVAGAMVNTQPVMCNNSVSISSTTATTSPTSWSTLLVASAAGDAIYFCGWDLQPNAIILVQIQSSASNSCTTPTTVATLINSQASIGTNLTDAATFWRGLGGPAPFNGKAACLSVTTFAAASGLGGTFYYTVASPGP